MLKLDCSDPTTSLLLTPSIRASQKSEQLLPIIKSPSPPVTILESECVCHLRGRHASCL